MIVKQTCKCTFLLIRDIWLYNVKYATVFSAIYCREQFDVIYYITFRWMAWGIMLSCMYISALWSPAGKGLTFWLSCMWCFLVFCIVPHAVSGSGVILYCIDSWSLLSYLLCTLQFETKLRKYNRVGITIFKIFIWGVISSNIRSENTLYGSSCASPWNYLMIYLTKWKFQIQLLPKWLNGLHHITIIIH